MCIFNLTITKIYETFCNCKGEYEHFRSFKKNLTIDYIVRYRVDYIFYACITYCTFFIKGTHKSNTLLFPICYTHIFYQDE